MNYIGFTDGQVVPDGYDKYTWISERCLTGIDYCRSHKDDFQIIEKNFKTESDTLEGHKYLENVKDTLLDYCVDVLNAYQETSYSKKAWTIMLSQWMNIFLFSFYDKYLKLKKAAARNEVYDCILLNTNNILPALDFQHFTELMFHTDDYHLLQYSALIEEMGMKEVFQSIQVIDYKQSPVGFDKKTKGYYKVFVYRKLLWLMKHITRKQDQIVFQNSYLPNEFVLEAARVRPLQITNYIVDYARYDRHKIPYHIDKEWRIRNENNRGYDEFTYLMVKLIRRFIPIAYAEGFRKVEKISKNIYKFAKEPKAVFFANGATHSDETFKSYLMRTCSTNAKLCGIQHGGDYGITNKWCFISEYEMCDVFYTWGWERKKDSKFKGMPLAKLVGHDFSDPFTNEDILYINYSYMKNISREDKSELTYDTDLENELEFFRMLPADIKKQMRIRIYMYEYGWHTKEKIREAGGGDLRIDTYRNFYDSLDNAKLLIISDWSTTIVEALFAGRPLIVRRDSMCIEDEAREDLALLKKAGILVETYDELLTRLQEVSNDVKKWWKEKERQNVINHIRKKYAYMPENAKQVWVDEICSWL